MKKAILYFLTLMLTAGGIAQTVTFTDTVYHFSFEYPASWTELRRTDDNLRVVLQSDDGHHTLMAYGLFLEDAYYDIEKLAAQDSLMFPGLGKVIDEDVSTVVPWVGQYLEWVVEGAGEILDIQKRYGPNEEGLYANAYFAVDEHYAYILIMYAPDDDFKAAGPVFDSFEKEAGWLTKFSNDSSWAYKKRSLIAVLFSVAVFIFLSGLAYSGRGFKKWQRRRRALLRHRDRLPAGETPDHRWRYAHRRSVRMMMLYILLFLCLGIPTVIVYSSSWIFWVAVPAFFLLGYFGYTLVVKD